MHLVTFEVHLIIEEPFVKISVIKLLCTIVDHLKRILYKVQRLFKPEVQLLIVHSSRQRIGNSGVKIGALAFHRNL